MPWVPRFGTKISRFGFGAIIRAFGRKFYTFGVSFWRFGMGTGVSKHKFPQKDEVIKKIETPKQLYLIPHQKQPQLS